MMSPDEIIQKFCLEPHPEGGWYRETWRSGISVNDGTGALGSLIYFLITAESNSAWHRLKSDEIWLWHAGSPVRIELGGTDKRPQSIESIHLGEQCAQYVINRDTWQSAYSTGEYSLVSCVVIPGFRFEDFELDDLT